jgi:cell division protein FtsN
MKSKIYLLSLVACVLMLSACKPKQSAYQKVYEAAQARPTTTATAEPAAPAPAAPSWNAAPQTAEPTGNFRTEQLTAVDGANVHQYGVVIGSFQNKTNATSLKERMANNGYSPVIAQNAQGMYRVIVASFDNKQAAYQVRDELKRKYSEFADAWLLEKAQ